MEIRRSPVIIAGNPAVYAKGSAVMDAKGHVFLSGSVGVDVKTGKTSKSPFMILAGCPLEESEAKPEIHLEQKDECWLVEVRKDEHYLKLKVFDEDELPEFEIVELR